MEDADDEGKYCNAVGKSPQHRREEGAWEVVIAMGLLWSSVLLVALLGVLVVLANLTC